MLFMLEKQALLGIVRSKSFSICQAAINKESQLAASEKLPSALCTSPGLLPQGNLPPHTHLQVLRHQRRYSCPSMWENASADSGLLNP